jgi:hypothetical protein
MLWKIASWMLAPRTSPTGTENRLAEQHAYVRQVGPKATLARANDEKTYLSLLPDCATGVALGR